MNMVRVIGLLLAGITGIVISTHAQDYMNQEALEQLLEQRSHDLESLPEVQYNYYIVKETSRLRARLRLYQKFGVENKQLIQLLNRNLLENLRQGDTLVIPNVFVRDLRAYSPFPRYYPGARNFDKLVVIDKSIQAFGAYEYGQLVRWGLVNTGEESYRTPTGRFNFNWKMEYKRSSMNPDWEMYWVFNFHEKRGLHIHQYAMPTGGPASHGCVRMVDADARWLFNWADTWVKRNGRILKQGTTLLIIGEDPKGPPSFFTFLPGFPVMKRVELPADPYEVPPGSEQQRYFDRLRARQAAQKR